MKLSILAGVAMATLMLVPAASASTMTISKQQSDIFAGGGAANVTLINYAGTPFANDRAAINVTAGGLRLTDGVNNFVAWCLDLTHWFYSGSQYKATSTPFQNTTGALNAQQLGDITKLFSINYKDLNLSSSVESAGFQLALWEIVNEKWRDYDLKTGSFQAANITQSAINFANDMLHSLGDAFTQSYEFTFYESAPGRYQKASQNLVSVTPVPLPAAGLLLGAGLAALYGIGRRRKAVKAA